jgi:hypothetical protein
MYKLLENGGLLPTRCGEASSPEPGGGPGGGGGSSFGRGWSEGRGSCPIIIFILLSLFQIIGCLTFFRFINIIMHLDIVYA